MNIGIVTTWHERGAAYVSRAYMESLSKQHQVFIYARGGEEFAIGDEHWDLPNVTWEKKIPNMTMVSYINWKDFNHWIKDRTIDILIFNEQRSWDVLLKLRKSGIILGAYVDYYTRNTIPFFKFYDFLICNTNRHFEVFKDFGQTFFIPWGTSVELCKPKEGGKDGNYVKFFHSAGMGGVNIRKGTDILVRAYQKVKGNTSLVIHSQVGLKKYPTVAEIIQNDKRIQFIEGTIPLPGLYYKGNVYVYPSRLDGIGLSIAEALACGLPVITTNNPPMNEFVIHGQTGYLVKVDKFEYREDDYYWPESICSENNLAEAMQYYVDNPQLILEQSTNARNYASAHLDWNKNSEELGRVLNFLKYNRNWTKQDLRSIRTFENAIVAKYLIKGVNMSLATNDVKNAFRLFTMAMSKEPKRIFERRTWSLAREFFGKIGQ